MTKIIAWLAVVALLYFAYFVLRRLLRLFFGHRHPDGAFHDQLADAAEDIANASRVAAALSSATVFAIAPAGFLALGSALGFVPTPLITRVLPFLLAFAFGSAALSAAAKLYAKSRRKGK